MTDYQTGFLVGSLILTSFWGVATFLTILLKRK